MIQYKYFHTDASGFVSRMSVASDDISHRYYSDIFEKVRKGVEINSSGSDTKTTFTYATVENAAVFMQASKSGVSSLYAEGLLCDSVPQCPARYIDKFNKAKSPADEEMSVLPAGRLPETGNSVDTFGLASRLCHIFPKLIDALIYGEKDKQIIILTNDRESAVNYVKVLSLFLPLSYMQKVGFSIGTNSIPYEPWTVAKETGELANVCVKIWLPEMENFDFDSYSSFYYIFDTRSGRDNYTRPLSLVAKCLEEIHLNDSITATEFSRIIESAFAGNGAVDIQLLEKLAVLYHFDLRRDGATAKSILNMGPGNDSFQERAFVNAVRILLAPENIATLSLDEKNRILREYQSNPNVAGDIEEDLFRYLVESYRTLQEGERSVLENILAADTSGARMARLLDSVPYADFDASVDAFGLSCRTLGACIAQGGSAHSFQRILTGIIDFFDIDQCRRAIPNEQLLAGERFFDIAWNFSDMNLKVYAAAVLMASAYFSDVDEECCSIRVRGLKRVLSASHLTSLQTLEVILGIRQRVLEFSDEISKIDYRMDFLLNTEVGREWVQDLIGAASIQDLLSAYRLIYSRTHGRILYEGMINILRARLLDLGYVRYNLIQGTPVYSSYVEFFRSLPQEIQAASVEINRYLNELNHGDTVRRKLSQSRRDFLMYCYQTLSPKDKAKVSGEQINIQNVSQHSERISDIFLESYKTSGKKIKQIFQKIFTVINGFAWFLVAFALMELVTKGLDFGLQDHLSLIYELHLLPIISALCSGALYVVNLSTNSVIKRNIFTGIETLLLTVVVYGVFRLILL